LRELLLANLIWVERDGRSLIYRPNAKFASQLSSFLLENCCSGKDCLTISTKQKAR